MKKNIGILLLLLICVLLTILIAVLSIMSISIDRKFSLLENAILNNEDIKNLEEKTIILSFSDNISSAVVKNATDISAEKAYTKVKEDVKKYIHKKQYDLKLLKVDVVTDIQNVTLDEFEKSLKEIPHIYAYRRGIIIEDSQGKDIYLLESELNANSIIDYTNYKLDINRLNNYLYYCGKNQIKKIPTELRTFSTISYFCDDKNNLYDIDSELGFRKQELNKNEIDKILDTSMNYLFNMIGDNGKFIYGYYPLADEEIESYNILRHAGSTWSLILEADSMEERQKIEFALDYIVSTIKYLDDETGFVQEIVEGEIKLGGNALSIIALCEYTEKYNDTRYVDVLNKLGNGMLDMQKKDGSYIHVLNMEDFSLKNEYRTVFYDGEATFALSKLYSVTKDKKYLDAAEKTVKFFIDNDYTQYNDHWISYAVNEITKYIDNVEYYEFGLKNVANNIDKISTRKLTTHTEFEMILQCFELYERIQEREIKFEYLNEFPIEKLLKTIKERAEFQLRSYMYPEVAMYLVNPIKYSNIFYIRADYYRIRMDDIQHSALGYHFYNKYFNKINEYLNEL